MARRSGELLLFGLRIGELCGLNRGDLDFARGDLRVRDGEVHATKTEAGHRVIPMLPAARELVVGHVLNHPCGADEPVFRTRTGRRQRPDNLRARVLRPAVQRANEILADDSMPPSQTCTPHTLRRTLPRCWPRLACLRAVRCDCSGTPTRR